MIKRYIYLLIFLLPATFSTSDAQDDGRVGLLIRNMQKFAQNYHPQNIRVRLSQDQYLAGDTIWAKVRLYDATTRLEDTTAASVFLELINTNSQRISTRILQLEQGIAAGYIPLHDSILQGNYQLVAYTNPMRNMGNDYFYQKNVWIWSKRDSSIFSERRMKQIGRDNKKEMRQNKPNAMFFPEGGHLTAGISNKVSIKFRNFADKKPTGGQVVDRKDNVLANFSCDANQLAIFEFTPESGTRYFVVPDNFPKMKFKLPRTSDGPKLILKSQSPEELIFTILRDESDIPLNQLRIVVEQDFDIVTHQIPESKQVSIATNLLKPGVVQLVLLSAGLEPLSQRLCFLPDKARPYTIPEYESTDSGIYLKLKNTESQTLDFAIWANRSAVSQKTKLSDFLTNSYRGVASADNTNETQITEKYLLASDYDKIDWGNLADDKIPPPQFDDYKNLKISGQISKLLRNRVPNAYVSLAWLGDYYNSHETRTNREGRFEFTDLDFRDSAYVLVETEGRTGRKNLAIQLDTFAQQTVRFEPQLAMNPQMTEEIEKWKTEKPSEKEYLIDNESIAELGNKVPAEMPEAIYGKADYTLITSELNGHYQDVYQLIQLLPGVEVTGRTITIRGPNSLLNSTLPLILLDGISVSYEMLDQIYPGDIARIDLLKSPTTTAMYGSRGANGVIAIYTKTGSYNDAYQIDLKMIGFQTPKNRGGNSAYTPLAQTYWQGSLKVAPGQSMHVFIPKKQIENALYIHVESFSADGRHFYLQYKLP